MKHKVLGSSESQSWGPRGEQDPVRGEQWQGWRQRAGDWNKGKSVRSHPCTFCRLSIFSLVGVTVRFL